MTATTATEQPHSAAFPGRLRKELAYIFTPRKRMIQIVVKMRDLPGALSGILSLLGTRVNLVSCTAYYDDEEGATFSGFAEPLDTCEKPAFLEKTIESSPSVLGCKVIEGSDGILVDSFHTGIETQAGEPLLFLRWNALNQMFDNLVKVFGSGGEVMLYYEGLSMGESNAREVAGKLGRDAFMRNVPSILRMHSAAGWGAASIVGQEASGAPVVRIENCFECSTRQRIRHECSFVKGLLAGVAEVAFGSEAVCVETKCRFKGDPHCEFSIRAG